MISKNIFLPVPFTWTNVDHTSVALFFFPVVFKNEGFGYVTIPAGVTDEAPTADARGKEVQVSLEVNGDVS